MTTRLSSFYNYGTRMSHCRNVTIASKLTHCTVPKNNNVFGIQCVNVVFRGYVVRYIFVVRYDIYDI